ncbi:hypothetical protein DFH29DRAFT_999676 [Suillus ampliporus]|nr:hypothetical protein DFH29DRAFT_999676 [Suillus ampliporus]
MQLILPILSFLLAPVATTACESACITNTTNQFLDRYTDPVLTALQNLESANQISTKLVPAPGRRENSIVYFTPVMEAYKSTAYASLEKAIFPSFFHGKCQGPDGVNPPGCPNPDCATVCGTPGSMVHF